MSIRSVLAHRKLLLNVFLTSIAINALLGIWALLVDDFGQTQGKVLVTSFLVSAAMLGVLVNGSPFRRRVLWPVPAVAAAASSLGFALFLVPLWSETDNDEWLKLAGSALTIGAAGTLAGLLALVGLQAGLERLRLVNNVFIAALTGMILIMIWGEIDGDWAPRLIGTLSILVAALTLAIPAIARVVVSEPSCGDAPGVRYCPSCGADLLDLGDGGATTCGKCGATFVIEFEASKV